MCDVSVTSIILYILCEPWRWNGKDYRRTSSINLSLNGDNVYRQLYRTTEIILNICLN